MSNIKFTLKQVEILNVIKNSAPCSVYDILDNITYECKRDAMLHSIRILIEHGYVERIGRIKLKGASYMYFKLTKLGEDTI